LLDLSVADAASSRAEVTPATCFDSPGLRTMVG
jgi:hypothetical protein